MTSQPPPIFVLWTELTIRSLWNGMQVRPFILFHFCSTHFTSHHITPHHITSHHIISYHTIIYVHTRIEWGTNQNGIHWTTDAGRPCSEYVFRRRFPFPYFDNIYKLRQEEKFETRNQIHLSGPEMSIENGEVFRGRYMLAMINQSSILTPSSPHLNSLHFSSLNLLNAW